MADLEVKALGYPRWISTTAGVILVIASVIGVVETVTVLYMFHRQKQLRSPTNNLIVALMFSDLCIAIGSCPITAYSGFMGYWAVGENMCIFEGWLVYCFGLTSLYLLMIVSVDRYIMIANPLKAALITNRVSIVAIGLCFAAGMFWSVLPLFGWSAYGHEPCGFACGLDWTEPSAANKSYIICMFIFCFFVPLIVILYCYYHVYMTIRHMSKNTVWAKNSGIARANLKKEKKVFKSIAILCACFIVCWTPYAILAFWQSFGDAASIPAVAAAVPVLLAKSELVWNPIIYVAMNKNFRNAFYDLLPCKGLKQMLVNRENATEMPSNPNHSNLSYSREGVTMNQTTRSANRNVVLPTVSETEPKTRNTSIGSSIAACPYQLEMPEVHM